MRKTLPAFVAIALICCAWALISCGPSDNDVAIAQAKSAAEIANSNASIAGSQAAAMIAAMWASALPGILLLITLAALSCMGVWYGGRAAIAFIAWQRESEREHRQQEQDRELRLISLLTSQNLLALRETARTPQTRGLSMEEMQQGVDTAADRYAIVPRRVFDANYNVVPGTYHQEDRDA